MNKTITFGDIHLDSDGTSYVTDDGKRICGAKVADRDADGKKIPDTSRPCTHRAGWLTPHEGIGRCKLHGGLTPVKTGESSKVVTATLRERALEMAGAPDILSLEYEIGLVRALIEKRVDSNNSEIDFAIIKSLDTLTKMVSTVHKIEHDQQHSIPIDAFYDFMSRVKVVMDELLVDPLPATAKELRDRLGERLGRLRLPPAMSR